MSALILEDCVTDLDDDSPYCDCDLTPTIGELENCRCFWCGKQLFDRSK